MQRQAQIGKNFLRQLQEERTDKRKLHHPDIHVYLIRFMLFVHRDKISHKINDMLNIFLIDSPPPSNTFSSLRD